MNTKDNWKTTATIYDKRRAELWGFIFPGAVVPIVSPVTQLVHVPQIGETQVYMLDLAAISDKQREDLITMLSTIFELSREEVAGDIDRAGVPIIAEGVCWSTSDQGLFLSIIEGLDDQREEPSVKRTCANCGASDCVTAGFPVSHAYCERCGGLSNG